MKQAQTIAIVGYGSQGKAWAANLRDSGYHVELLLQASSPRQVEAVQQRFIPTTLEDHDWHSQTYALLIPDHRHRDFLRRFSDRLPHGATLIVAHGYSLTFDALPLRRDLDVLLLAPKIIGAKLREHYLQGSPTLFAVGVYQNTSGHGWRKAAALARALGGAAARLVHTTCREEAVADLFSEQALLCGGLPGLVAETYNLMVAHGVHPTLAQQECFQEVALIASMLAEHGIDGLQERISMLARVGGLRARRYLIDTTFRRKLERLLSDIEDGSFADVMSGIVAAAEKPAEL